MSEYIGIEFTEIGDNYLKGRMPVDHRTNQPYGLLHGGASCVLAETLGSIASALVIDQSAYLCVGIEINANHIRSAKKKGLLRERLPHFILENLPMSGTSESSVKMKNLFVSAG